MNTCKTCRFWESSYSICHKRFVDVITPERPFKSDSLRVHVWPSGGAKDDIVHNVFTGPDFGCVHHQPAAVECVTGEQP